MAAGRDPGSFQFFDTIYKKPLLIPILIIISSIAILLANIWGLRLGITVVFPHLFYIPIILASYYYPKRGVLVAIILSACYCTAVFTISTSSTMDVISAVARSIVFILIAAVVASLSSRMHNDTQMCRRLVSAVRFSGDAIIGETFDGTVTDWNIGAERLYGYTAQEMVGQSIFRLIPPERLEEKRELLRKIQQGISTERLDTERITKDGRRITVSLSSSPILNSVGEMVGASQITHDITERRRLQNEILIAKEQWERTFDAVPDMIAIIDNHFRVVQVNKAMADRLHTVPGSAIGQTCYDIVHHTNTPIDFCPHRLLIGDGKSHSVEIHEDNLNGDFFLTVSPIRDASGNVLGSVHILHDITERKQAEDALKGALKKLNMLSSITRHDIMNQVTGLRAYLELSKEELKGTRFEEFIIREDQAAEAIQRQIEFTRYYQDIGVNAPKWQGVAAIIREAVAQLSLPGIDLQIDVGEVEVFADPLIVKVFFNLMENSLRHGERITTMAFSSTESEAGLVIRYRDNGVGITEADKKKLFQKGFGKHTGLGLYLSREILAITGISITENGEPGKGVRFEIVVPEGAWRVAGHST